jgi:hypothetical protein
MEKQLAWIHSPPRAQVSFRWSTRRSTVRSAAGCGMGRGSRGSTQGYIRENKADRANKLLLSYVKMGLSEQAHLQRRKMEDRGLPVSQESEDALRKIPAAHDWRSRTPVEVADIAASHSREQLDLNADRKHWKAQGNMHVTILNERDLAAAKDEQVKADMAELHTTVTGLDMFSVSLLFRGKAVQIYLDAGTPFRVVRTAVQASFGLHPEQQLLYLRKACNVVAPPKETRPEKAPSLSITRLAKIKALARNAAERARNNARTKEIDGETHPQEW